MKRKFLIINAIKAKKTGLTDKAIESFADNIDKKLEDDGDIDVAVAELEDFITITKAEADRRVTLASQDKKKDPKKKNVKDDEDDEDEEGDGQENELKTDSIKDPAVKAMLKALSDLTKEVATLKGGETSKTRKQQLESSLEKAPKQYKEAALEVLEHANFTDDTFKAFMDKKVEGIPAFEQTLADEGLSESYRPVETGVITSKEQALKNIAAWGKSTAPATQK